jgi:predicted  nucleic acid-binding Zn-ribbon protein
MDAEFARISETLARLYEIVGAHTAVTHRIGAVRTELAAAESAHADATEEAAEVAETLRGLRGDVGGLRQTVAQTEAENRAMEAAQAAVRQCEE